MRMRGFAVRRRFPWTSVLFVMLAVSLGVICAFSLAHAARARAVATTILAWDRRVSLSVHQGTTVGEVLDKANIRLFPGDRCAPGLDAILENESVVNVTRAVPRFVQCDGKTSAVMTSLTQVRDILTLASITPGPDDLVTPEVDGDLSEPRIVKVVRVTYGRETAEVPVEFRTESRNDSSLETGLTKIYINGEQGLARIDFEVKYEDGEEVQRTEVGRDLIREPQNQVVLVGTVRQVSRGGDNLRFSRAIDATISAYCACQICCGKYANGYTHTGLPAKKGVIAVDPSVIPLGTRVYVDGYGYAVAADTGGAIKGTRVDVCFDTHQEALAWGVKKARVFLLE